MMRIALAGNISSGKSTVAKELEKRGFYLLNYTEHIKEEVAEAMQTVGVTTTKEEALKKIKNDKELYRPLLISWADACGWSDGSRLKEFLSSIKEENIVLDNIRYLPQAKIAKQAGFILLKLQGGRIIDMPSERSLDVFPFDAEVPWMENVKKRIEYILDLLSTFEK